MSKSRYSPFTLSNRILLHIDSFKVYFEEIDIVTPPKDLIQRYIASGVGAKYNQVRARLNELLREGYVMKVQKRPLGIPRVVPVYLLTEKGRKRVEKIKKIIDSMKVQVKDEHGRIYEESLGDLKKRIFPFPNYNEIYRMLQQDETLDIAVLRDYRRRGVKVTELGDSPVVTRLYGRELERVHLMDGLKGYGPNVYVIKGIAGVGKSTLAKSVVEFFINEANIFWYTMKEDDSPGSLLRAMAAFLKKCGYTALSNLLKARESVWPVDELRDALERDLSEHFAILVIDDTHHAHKNLDMIRLLGIIKEVAIESRGLKVVFITRFEIPYYSLRDIHERKVFLLHLKELEFDAAREILREKGIPEEYHESIYSKLGGNPQVLELLQSGTTDFEKLPDNVTEFIVREVLERLTPMEKKALLFATVLRKPVSYRIFYREERLFPAHVDMLADKSVFLRTLGGNYYMVEVVKETVKSLYPEKTFERYYDLAAEYYLDEGDPPSIIEALYYLMRRQRYDDAFEVILNHYDQIITAGLLQELKNYIDELEASPWEKRTSADFLVVKAYVLYKFNMIKECSEALGGVEEGSIKIHNLKAVLYETRGYMEFVKANWEGAFEEFKRLLNFAEREGLPRQKLIAAEHLGKICWKTGEAQRGREILEEALKEAEELGDNTLKGNLMLTYALIIEDAYEGPEASMPIIEEAIRAFKSDGNMYDLARAFNNLGVAQYKLKEDWDALISWKKARHYGVRAYNRYYKLYSELNLADVYSKRREYKDALKYLKQAEEGVEETGNRVLLPYVHLNRAIVYENMKRYREAKESFSRAIEEMKGMGTPLNMAEIYLLYTKFLWKVKRKKEACLYKRKCLELYRRYGGEEIYQKAREELKNICRTRNI